MERTVKKMYDQKKIVFGIITFVVVLTVPFWQALGREFSSPNPNTDTPVIQQMAQKQCIEDTDYMRNNHMKLLNDWRMQAVRNGQKVYTAQDGKRYHISIQQTCLDCHSNKAEFCDRCHTYAEVEPDCWDCHIGGE